MKNTKSSLAAPLLIVAGLIFSLCLSGLVPSGATAQSNTVDRASGNSRRKEEKISDTLRGRKTKTGDEIVQVIIQLKSSPTGRFNALLQRNGVHLKDNFKELNSLAVELPLSVVSELSDFAEVEFVSGDADVQMAGRGENYRRGVHADAVRQ